MLKFIAENANNKNIQILHITGERFFEKFVKQLRDMGIDNTDKNIKVVPYFYEMPKALNIADLTITSGGAITIAELTAVGLPSIIVPKGYTAENHQEYNAKALDDKGASVMIKEKDLTYEVLSKTIYEILNDRPRLEEMSKNSKAIGIKDADKKIVNLVEEIIK